MGLLAWDPPTQSFIPKPSLLALTSLFKVINDSLPPYPKAAYSKNLNPLGANYLNENMSTVSFQLNFAEVSAPNPYVPWFSFIFFSLS